MKLFFGILVVGFMGFSGIAQPLSWGSMSDIEKTQANNPKKVLVYVTTAWCGWCTKMNANTFTDAEIISYLNSNFHLVKLDAEEKDTILFKDYEFKFVKAGRRGYNDLAYSILDGKLSYPSLVFLDEKLDRISIAPGYRDATDLTQLLDFVSKEIYKSKSWEEYQKGK